jgi:CopG family nickel-responsive transcriptional regulator
MSENTFFIRYGGSIMQRITISIDDNMAAAIDAFMTERGYAGRSEAIRDLVRDGLVRSVAEGPARLKCVAAVSYVYNYDGRDLSLRLDRAQHDNHDLTIATMRTRLDHSHCMEVTLLRGQTQAVRRLGEAMIAERGVHFGQINMVPIRSGGPLHRHGAEGHSHEHGSPVL